MGRVGLQFPTLPDNLRKANRCVQWGVIPHNSHIPHGRSPGRPSTQSQYSADAYRRCRNILS